MTTLSKTSLSELRTLIDKADSLYYRPGCEPIMSDAGYDGLKMALKEQCPDDPRFSRVGVPYSPDELRTKTEHNIPMGSLDNTDGGISGYNKWYQGICDKLGVTLCDQECSVFATVKADGASICATYVDGKLERATTRGNGAVGEDITANAVNFHYLPTMLSENVTVDVRGEAILYKADFEDLCALEDITSNPRNVGNGILGRDSGKDSNLVRFLAFDVVGESVPDNENDKFNYLSELGFTTVLLSMEDGDNSKYGGLMESPQDVEGFYKTIFMVRDTIPFEIDGFVVKVNDNNFQESLSSDDPESQLRPKYARAIKFPHKSNTTVIEDVILTVGHTGAIIPTAKLKEVRIGGINVTHALLNNWDEISRLNVGIGDEVEVVLAGDIIPKIIGVTHSNSDKSIPEPDRCPACGSITTRELRGRSGAATYCSNDECPAVLLGKIHRWIGDSKKGVGILGVGDKIEQAMWDAQLVEDPADLYSLKVSDLEDLELEGDVRVGKSRAQKIINAIQLKSELTLPVFLGSLGIELLGRRRVQLLMNDAGGDLDNLDDWLNDNKLTSIDLPGFGDAVRNAVRTGIDENRSLIIKMIDNGVVIMDKSELLAENKSDKNGAGDFSGLSFCFTGTRQHLQEIQDGGGEIKSGVSKKLHYLVQKDPLSKSSKTRKAEEYGVKVISVRFLGEVLEGKAQL
jgi:DNA ligase (NAD+)